MSSGFNHNPFSPGNHHVLGSSNPSPMPQQHAGMNSHNIASMVMGHAGTPVPQSPATHVFAGQHMLPPQISPIHPNISQPQSNTNLQNAAVSQPIFHDSIEEQFGRCAAQLSTLFDHANESRTQLESSILTLDEIASRLGDLKKSAETLWMTAQSSNAAADPNIINQLRQLQEQEAAANQQLDTVAKLCQDALGSALTSCSNIQSILTGTMLPLWQRQRQLETIAVPRVFSLNQLQDWFVRLFDTEWFIRGMVGKLQQTFVNQQTIVNLGLTLGKLIEDLVSKSLVVETQPRVLRTHKKQFQCVLRFLVGTQINPAYFQGVRVTASLVSELTARQHMTSGLTFPIRRACEVHNAMMPLEIKTDDSHYHYCVIQFRNLGLKDFNRRSIDRKAHDNVTDDKLAFLFHCEVQLPGIDQVRQIPPLKVLVWALSLPLVVTVHDSQWSRAQATLLWDNCFSRLHRGPFDVPTCVAWRDIKRCLSGRFAQLCGKEISEEHTYLFFQKIAGVQQLMAPNNTPDHLDNFVVTWQQFARDHMPGYSFTFAEWFFSIAKLVMADHLQIKPFWKRGLIVGFINRQQTEEVLANEPPGTFLLRFSESELSALNISHKTTENRIKQYTPWKQVDFRTRQLCDRLMDCETLRFFWGDPRRKSEVLAPFIGSSGCNTGNQDNRGYWFIPLKANEKTIGSDHDSPDASETSSVISGDDHRHHLTTGGHHGFGGPDMHHRASGGGQDTRFDGMPPNRGGNHGGQPHDSFGTGGDVDMEHYSDDASFGD